MLKEEQNSSAEFYQNHRITPHNTNTEPQVSVEFLHGIIKHLVAFRKQYSCRSFSDIIELGVLSTHCAKNYVISALKIDCGLHNLEAWFSSIV